jgi:hypothetical protein
VGNPDVGVGYGVEPKGFVVRVLRAMPDIGGYKHDIPSFDFILFVANNLLSAALQVILYGFAMRVIGALLPARRDLHDKGVKVIYVEAELRGYEVSYLVRFLEL